MRAISLPQSETVKAGATPRKPRQPAGDNRLVLGGLALIQPKYFQFINHKIQKNATRKQTN